MFTISPTTFAGILRVEEQRFVARLIAVLRETVPSLRNEPQPEMEAQVLRLREQARAYEMISERGVGAYVMTAAQLGLDFVARFAGARQILFMSVPEEEKADLLEAFTLSLFETLAR